MKNVDKQEYYWDLLKPLRGVVTIGNYELEMDPMVGSISFCLEEDENETQEFIYCTPFWEHMDGIVIQRVRYTLDDEDLGDTVVIPIEILPDDNQNLINFLMLMEAYMRANGLVEVPEDFTIRADAIKSMIKFGNVE